MMDATNIFIKKAQVTLKNIIGLDAFINKEQWSIIWMKEEYHAKLENKGKNINWCSIMLTQMSIKLT